LTQPARPAETATHTVNGTLPSGASPLDAVLEATRLAPRPEVAPLDRFLDESSPWKSLHHWLGDDFDLKSPDLKLRVAQKLSRDIVRIDAMLNKQVNAILHHETFQNLEASWRGLRYLIDQTPEDQNIKVRLLNVSWKELARDAERALEFDQSQLFKKVYGEEFGTPGGEPFSILIGDYDVRHRVSAEHPIDDLAVLISISQVAAAAFAPFIASAHPSLLDLESFADLERPLNLPRTFEQIEYLKWRSFRHTEDARFVGLTLPRLLFRLPYQPEGPNCLSFPFREDVEQPDRSGYLWGNAAFGFAAVVVRAFAETGWPASIRGVQRGVIGGGVVAGLPGHSFRTDSQGIAIRCSTDTIVTDFQEKELGELGFIPLCHCQDTDHAVFYGNQSVQMPPKFDELAATMNARLSSMLQYMLCVSRFAHYVKVISRDKVGSFKSAGDCEGYLRKWLTNFVTSNENASMEQKAKHPLREAQVKIREVPDKPGTYMCVVHLRPHFQLDQLVSSVKLVTELAPGRPAT
jgi:type VI secretion system protein ImpD